MSLSITSHTYCSTINNLNLSEQDRSIVLSQRERERLVHYIFKIVCLLLQSQTSAADFLGFNTLNMIAVRFNGRLSKYSLVIIRTISDTGVLGISNSNSSANNNNITVLVVFACSICLTQLFYQQRQGATARSYGALICVSPLLRHQRVPINHRCNLCSHLKRAMLHHVLHHANH